MGACYSDVLFVGRKPPNRMRRMLQLIPTTAAAHCRAFAYDIRVGEEKKKHQMWPTAKT